MKSNFNNIVLIDAYNSVGTGIILPCRYDKADDGAEGNNYDYFIVITNYHVIHSGEKLDEPVKEISGEDISLTIFDKDMRLVPYEDYEIVKMEAEFSPFEEEDIAAILVKIRKIHEIERCCQIGDLDEIHEGEDIYTKGFPGILQEEAEALPIRFMGSLQLNCYKGGKMGTYQTKENFHFYSNYGDEDMFCGLSGGPVFMEQAGEIKMIGMNQGIFANHYGDSPYQLIRFIEIKHILEYLRQNGCILYSLLYGNISVIWIKDENQAGKEKKNGEKEAICVLGGSGAGKSSFVESLTQHAQILETVGDGQTTRTDIYYYLSLFNNEPSVKVIFLDKRQFAEKMYKAVFPDLLAIIFEYEFGLRKIDIRVEPYRFLVANLDYLEILLEKCELYEKNEKKLLCIQSLCNSEREEEETEEINQCYAYFCNMVHQCADKHKEKSQMLKRIFDLHTREKIMKSLISLNKNSVDTEIYSIDGIDLSDFFRVIKKIDSAELVRNLQELPYNAKEAYVCAVLEKRESGETDSKEVRLSNALRMVFEEQKGIFAFKEVSFLFENHPENNTKLFGVQDCDELKNDVLDTFWNETEIKANKIEKIYENLYEQVMEKLKNEKEILRQGVSLTKMTRGEKKLINLCVRGSNKKSLSAFIDHIEVRDSYYYEYSVPIYESRQNEILLIDTCGLDHIDKGKGNRFTLSERVVHINGRLNNMEGQYRLNNIIYLKKLDAGKPTEISDIFAYIADMDLEGGLYCVFTGLDIYESSNASFFAKNKNWHIDNNFDRYPKVMQYLIDKQYKEELLRMCNCVFYRKEDLYRVMSRNVITYCANKRLIEKRGRYQENNVVGIKNLFQSIFQKETDLLNVSIESDVEKYERVIEKNKGQIKSELKKLIIMMFDLASVTKWQRYYWQTLNANLKRYMKGEKGFARSYDHTWRHLFAEGYRKTFEKEYSEDFYKLFGEYEKITFSLVRQMKYDYVRDIMNECLEKMYRKCSEKEPVNIINVYDTERVKEECGKADSNTFGYAKVLGKITNFGLLIRTYYEENEKNEENELADRFLTMLRSKYKEKARTNDFLETRADIRSKMDELIKALKSYGFKEEAVKVLFCRQVDENERKQAEEFY